MPENIVLVGFMGTGKSVTGKALADQLGYTFVDMDEAIEERTGRKIADIFATEGEAYFREQERELARELSARSDLVIATGGGIVLNPANIEDLGRNGMVVCLHTNPDRILQRVAQQQHRPLLEGDTEKALAIRTLLEKRKPLYDAIPIAIDTTGHTPADTATEILALYRAHTN
jgi:shikimate kinase